MKNFIKNSIVILTLASISQLSYANNTLSVNTKSEKTNSEKIKSGVENHKLKHNTHKPQLETGTQKHTYDPSIGDM